MPSANEATGGYRIQSELELIELNILSDNKYGFSTISRTNIT